MLPAEVFCTNCGAANNAQDTHCFACHQPLQAEAVLAATQHEHVLRQRYRLLNRLGQGGMGSVYRAEDTELGNRPVAIKELSQKGLNQDEAHEAEASFKHEALLLAGLMHPNLPRIYDNFAESGRWYLVMDFIEGETLDEMLARRGGKLSWSEIFDIAIQLCSVLTYLHTRPIPIIFRDLKPLNVMLTDKQQVYLIDFGIARLFKPGQAHDTIAFGSPGYAAPEQYGKAQTTPSADIYSLGAMLHQMFTGIDPSNTPFAFAKVSSAPSGLQQLLDEMLSLDASKRIADATIVERRLRAINQEEERKNSKVSSQTTKSTTSTSKATPYYTPPAASARAVPPSAPIASTYVSASTAQSVAARQAWAVNTGKLVPAPSGAPVKSKPVTYIYEGHIDRVNALAWSPNSRRVASASNDRTVQICDRIGGKMIALYDGHSRNKKRWQANHVNTVVWSRARDILASSADDGVIHIWRAEPEPQTLLTYDQHKGNVVSIAWSPDGKMLASASHENLHIWNPDNGKTLARFAGYAGAIQRLDWSLDNTQLVLGNEDGSVEIVKLDAQNTTIEHHITYPVNCGKVTAVRWSPDGTRIAFIGTKGGVQIWDVASSRRLLEYTDHRAPVYALDWSPDSKAIVSVGGDGRIQIWNAQNERTIDTHPGLNTMVRAIAWSPDGQYIAFGSHTKVQLWPVDGFAGTTTKAGA